MPKQRVPLSRVVDERDAPYPVRKWILKYTITANFTPCSAPKPMPKVVPRFSPGWATWWVRAARRRARHGFAQFTAGKAPQLNLKLTHRAGDTFTTTLNLVPPRGHNNLPDVSPARPNATAAAWPTRIPSAPPTFTPLPTPLAQPNFAAACSLDFARVRPLTVKSCGNWQTLFDLLKARPDNTTLRLLETLTDKDLRDFSLPCHPRPPEPPSCRQGAAFASSASICI